MLRRFLVSSAVAALLLGRAPSGIADAPKATPPLSLTIDVSEVPDLKAWAEKAKELAETWYPKITKELATDGFTPPSKVTIAFKANMDGVAGTAGDHIDVSARWVREHPEDFGMVIHELTHVIQSYPEYRPSWLVEGIADYVRYWQFEPESQGRRFDPNESNFRSGYQPAANFLDWLETSKRKGVIKELNLALRQGVCTEETIEKLAGDKVDTLWTEFLEARAAKRRATTAPKGGGLRSSSPLGDIGLAPATSLIDATGQPFTLKNLRGKAVLVSFIFTTCNGTCPATTTNLQRIQEKLKEAKLWGDKVAIVSISIDPTRDTPDVLANYARNYNADSSAWHFLTGSPQEVSQVVKDWGMWVKSTSEGVVDHSSRVFLLDPKGHEREIYNLDYLKPDAVLQDVKSIVEEGASS